MLIPKSVYPNRDHLRVPLRGTIRVLGLGYKCPRTQMVDTMTLKRSLLWGLFGYMEPLGEGFPTPLAVLHADPSVLQVVPKP